MRKDIVGCPLCGKYVPLVPSMRTDFSSGLKTNVVSHLTTSGFICKHKPKFCGPISHLVMARLTDTTYQSIINWGI